MYRRLTEKKMSPINSTPEKRGRVSDNVLEGKRFRGGQSSNRLVSSIEHCTSSLSIQRRHTDKVDQLTLNSERQSTLELRQ